MFGNFAKIEWAARANQFPNITSKLQFGDFWGKIWGNFFRVQVAFRHFVCFGKIINCTAVQLIMVIALSGVQFGLKSNA